MPAVHEVPAELRELVADWLGRFAVVHPYHATALAVRSGSMAVVREYAEALAAFAPSVVQNAAIDLRNTSEHFPSVAEWRQRCATTVMRPTVAARSSNAVPEWMAERIALQNARCAVMLDAMGLRDAPAPAAGKALARVTARLLREWDANPEWTPLARDFTQYRPIDAATLADWTRWACGLLDQEAAEKRAATARGAQSLRTTQADSDGATA